MTALASAVEVVAWDEAWMLAHLSGVATVCAAPPAPVSGWDVTRRCPRQGTMHDAEEGTAMEESSSTRATSSLSERTCFFGGKCAWRPF